MRPRRSHTSSGEATIVCQEPKNQRMPSLESSERTPSILVAESSHERMKSRASDNRRTRPTAPNLSLLRSGIRRFEASFSLFFIRVEVVDVEDAELNGPDDEARGVDAAVALGEEFLDELVLPLLKALHAERHAAQVGNLLLGKT